MRPQDLVYALGGRDCDIDRAVVTAMRLALARAYYIANEWLGPKPRDWQGTPRAWQGTWGSGASNPMPAVTRSYLNAAGGQMIGPIGVVGAPGVPGPDGCPEYRCKPDDGFVVITSESMVFTHYDTFRFLICAGAEWCLANDRVRENVPADIHKINLMAKTVGCVLPWGPAALAELV